jgi:hypothetical protein
MRLSGPRFPLLVDRMRPAARLGKAIVCLCLLAACVDGPVGVASDDIVALHFASSTVEVAEGEDAALTLHFLDWAGRAVPPPPGLSIVWRSSRAEVAEVRADGRVHAFRGGEAVVTASAAGREAHATVRVLSREPDVLSPGTSATLRWGNFSARANGNAVTIDGVPAAVLHASAGEIQVRVPGRSAFPCGPARPVIVRVTTDGVVQEQTMTLRVGARLALAPGEAALLADTAALGCLELEPGAVFGVAVVNTTTAASAQTRFRLRGHAPSANSRTTGAAPQWFAAASGHRDADAADAHLQVLEASRRLVEQLAATPRQAAASGPLTSLAASASAAAPVLRIGDRVRRRVPVLDSGQFGSCTQFVTIDARVVHAGSRALLLEDVAAPVAGMLDTHFAALAAEYETRMLPVLATYFGDIEAYSVNRDGRVEMIFTRRVNHYGAAGFVWAGDLVPPTGCGASNGNETMYIGLPDQASAIAAWWRHAPSTVMHEAKHLVAYGERLSRGMNLEESWLEESTARIAEEIWGRSLYGYQQGANATAAEAGCGLRGTTGACAGAIHTVNKHFVALRDVFRSPESHTPFGNPTGSDYSFYGNAWWLVRYAADHSGRPEAEFFRALTADRRRGAENLAAHAGIPMSELLGHWHLATLLDDRADFAAANSRHRHPSWNSRDVLTTLAGSFPLNVRSFAGGFAAEVTALRAGAAWYAEIASGPGQAISLDDAAGAAPPPSLRLGIARLR